MDAPPQRKASARAPLRQSRQAPGAGFALTIVGFAAVILAAREQFWTLGHWSQDLSPIPLLAGIALISAAIDGLGPVGGFEPGPRETASWEGSIQVRGWHHLGVVFFAVGISLLGRSGLAVAFSLVFGAALAGLYSMRSGAVR